MKVIAVSILSVAFLGVVSLQFLKISEASGDSFSKGSQPTPSPTPGIKTVLPTPVCSPQPRPLSEKEKNNPPRELTLENFVNIGVGTPDFDCDGICNFNDNCPSIYDPDQKDSNADSKGDACDPELVDPSFIDSRCDMDGDGVPDIKDNCPSACNPDQKFVDSNDNKVNDLCDSALPNFAFDKPCAKRKNVKAQKPSRPVKVPSN